MQITPDLIVTNKFRDSRSTQNYIGTLPEAPVIKNPLSASTLSANPQSRLQITNVLANQTEATYKFYDGLGFKHTALAGVELDRETSSIDKYTGLSSEALPGGFSGTGSLTGVSVFDAAIHQCFPLVRRRWRDCRQISRSTPRAATSWIPPIIMTW